MIYNTKQKDCDNLIDILDVAINEYLDARERMYTTMDKCNSSKLKQDESYNLLDTLGMDIVEHLAACEYLRDDDVPQLLRKLADEWLDTEEASQSKNINSYTEKGLM